MLGMCPAEAKCSVCAAVPDEPTALQLLMGASWPAYTRLGTTTGYFLVVTEVLLHRAACLQERWCGGALLGTDGLFFFLRRPTLKYR